MSLTLALVEHGIIPDALTRSGIRRLLAQRLRDEASAEGAKRRARYLADLVTAPLAIEQAAANAQHYEVPSRLYELCLGKRLKYSSGWWGEGIRNLDEAEEAMLAKSVAHAGVRDGMDILEIGCGWGSLSLYMAEHFPNARILSISNSRTQREFITVKAAARGFSNLTVLTRDVVQFETTNRFDRVVSIECFEHLRNYHELFRRISGWLKPGGKLWTHIFVHREYTYPFETAADDSDDGNWMSRHFFTGGQMPSFNLFSTCNRDLVVEDAVAVNGTHYGKTARAWLNNIDQHKAEAREVLASPGVDPAVQFNRWRMFFMSCEELWNYRAGDEWLVGHYLLAPKPDF